MSKRLFVAASALLAVAAIVFAFSSWRGGASSARRGFVRAHGVRFVVDGKPFRFVGANVDVMFQQETRAAMPEMMRVSAASGMKVVRIWASGEGGLEDVQPANNWRRDRWFRRTPTEWNEAEFVFLDRTIAEAARHGLKVQICLANWWRDTGGVTQYLRWAGINGADDDNYPFGINDEKAMAFYTNETTRRLYREHVERIVGRRNTVTGVMYRDDPNIFGYELMNEARCLTGRWDERRAWITEMSAYVKSLDANHVLAPGVWGYRTAAERREWLKDHAVANIDYVDVHNYPRDDEDSFVDSPKALGEFIANRVSAAAMLQKPLVFGEFGVPHDGFNGASLLEWYRAFFEYSARDGASGAMFWILTPEPTRGYGVTYTTNRDAALLAEIRGASHVFSSLMNATPPPTLLNAGKHLVPRQFAFARNETDESVRPQIVYEQDGRVLYKFAPETVVRGRFEKLGGGPGYIWGGGVGYFEFIVPGRETRRRVGEVVVRAHIQPVLPTDAKPGWIRTRVTLFVNGTQIESRLVTWEDAAAPQIQEWKIDSLGPRLRAARGLPFTVRFEVTPEADWLYGVNISNWPEGYDSKGAAPVEVELR